MPRRVLIVTESFPPFNAIASRRVAAFARHLPRFGWDPWVLTTWGEGPLEVPLPEARILRVTEHPWVRRRLTHGVMAGSQHAAGDGILNSQSGLQVAGLDGNRGVNVQAETTSRQSKECLQKQQTRTFPKFVSQVLQGMRRAPRAAINRGFRQGKALLRRCGFRLNTYYPANSHWRRAVLNQRDALFDDMPPMDAILATYSPTAAFQIASDLSVEWEIPWLADFRDLAALRPDGANRLSRTLDLRRERKLVATATGILTVGTTLADLLRDTHRRPTWVVYNGWDDEDLPGDAVPQSSVVAAQQETDSQNWRSQPFVYHAGYLYAHRLPAIAQLLEAVSSATPKVHVVLRSLGPETVHRKIQQLAEKHHVTDRVHLLPACPPEQVQAEAGESLANLVLEDLDRSDPAGAGTLTGKLLKLVVAGKPVLAIARADAEMGDVLRTTRTGRLCPTADEIAEMLTLLTTAAADRLQRCFGGDNSVIQQFQMQEQTRGLAQALDACCAVGALQRFPIPYLRAS